MSKSFILKNMHYVSLKISFLGKYWPTSCRWCFRRYQAWHGSMSILYVLLFMKLFKNTIYVFTLLASIILVIFINIVLHVKFLLKLFMFVYTIMFSSLMCIKLFPQVNHPKYNQRRVSMVRYLGELYNYRMVESAVIFRVLYSFITFGVNYDGKQYAIFFSSFFCIFYTHFKNIFLYVNYNNFNYQDSSYALGKTLENKKKKKGLCNPPLSEFQVLHILCIFAQKYNYCACMCQKNIFS